MWLHDHVVEGASSPVSHLDEWRREGTLRKEHYGRHNILFGAGQQAVPVHLWMGAAVRTDRVDPPDCRRQGFATPDAELTAIRFRDRGRPPIGGRLAHRHLHIGTCPRPSLRVTPPSTPARVSPWQCVGLS